MHDTPTTASARRRDDRGGGPTDIVMSVVTTLVLVTILQAFGFPALTWMTDASEFLRDVFVGVIRSTNDSVS